MKWVNLQILCLFALLLIELLPVQSHYFVHPKGSIKLKNIKEKNIHPKFLQNSPKISVTPTSLDHSGDLVTVSWSGINGPTSDDWVGVYSPANVDRTKTAPTKFRWANSSSTHLTTGSGSMTFNLINGRADYSFTFFQNGLTEPVSVATSEVVIFKNYNEPLQGRLSLTTQKDEMRVMWSTLSSSRPQVKWGEASGKYNWVVDASTMTYGTQDLCGEPATTWGWRDPGLLHTAILKQLQKGKQYFYIYGDDQYGWSQESSFFPILGSDPNEKIRFYAFGDSGQGPIDGSLDPKWNQPDAINVTKLMVQDLAEHKNDTHLVLHIGDISYAVGYAAEWDDFGEQVSPLAKQLAYQTSPGNHETDWPGTDSIFVGSDSGGECGVPFYLRFPLPDSSSASSHWYSFNSGPLHVIMLSTEHNFTSGSSQYQWLQKDLAAVDRSQTPWILLTGHRPMYVDSTYSQGNSSDTYVSILLRDHIEPLMFKYQVDVGFWGHHHSYQRTCFVQDTVCLDSPISSTKNNTTTSSYTSHEFVAPIHFLIGMGGASHSTNLRPDQPDYIEYVNDFEYGYALVEVDSHRSFHLSFITESNELRDDFWLYKDY